MDNNPISQAMFEQFQAFQRFMSSSQAANTGGGTSLQLSGPPPLSQARPTNSPPPSITPSNTNTVASQNALSQFQGFQTLVSRPDLDTSVSASQTSQATAGTGSMHPPTSLGPIQNIYQSARLGGLLPLSTAPAAPSTSQPFLGISALAPMTHATQQANQNCLNSAAATLPRQEQVARRTRRRPQPSPALPRTAPQQRVTVNDCLVSSDPTRIRLQVRIYPPQVPQGRSQPPESVHYSFSEDAVTHFLQSRSLLFEYPDLPLQTSVKSLINDIQSQMVASPMQYHFAPVPTLPGASSIQHLTLLKLKNRGTVRRDGQIYLSPHCVSTETIYNLAANSSQWAHQSCITEANYLVLCLIVSRFPLQHMQGRTEHTCLAQHFLTLFPRDNDFGQEDGSWCETEDEDEPEVEVVATEPADSPSAERCSHSPSQLSDHSDLSLGTPTPAGRAAAGRTHFNLSRQPLAPDTSLVTGTSRDLPAKIWDSNHPWAPAYTHDTPLYNMDGLTSSIQNAACHYVTPQPRLEIEGASLDELADAYIKEIDLAGVNNDYTRVLARSRMFRLERNSGPPDSQVSIGIGIEKEVLYYIWNRYLQTQSQWFVQRDNGYSTIKCIVGLSARAVSPQRLASMKRFGAIAALMYAHGYNPAPLSPALILFIVNDLNLNCLTPAFIGEWFPELRQLILDWKALGPNGQVVGNEFAAHFATYHNTEVTAYRIRDQETHEVIAVEMLYKATLGDDSHRLPEFKAFAEGFRLPCQNGFNFLKIWQRFRGGPECFLSLSSASVIHNYESIEEYIIFSGSSQANHHQLAQLREYLDDPLVTFQELFIQFLKGQGIPCPHLFDSVKETFSEVVDLTLIDAPAFQSRMLAWATTGSPLLDVASGLIKINAAQDTEILPYHANNRTCTFRTCSMLMRYPLSYFIKLASAQYPGTDTASGEPASFEAAYQHWLLVELLNGIGNHTML